MPNATLPPPAWDAYKCSDVGLLLPFLDESNWSITVRAILYLVALLYTFFGVSIAADVFMSAIERITSQTRRVRVHTADLDSDELGGGDSYVQYKEVLVWNPTVANLTLMALGSSAPEILLSCIEVIGRGFKSGDLGPSTIVGSAAFNLLVITAVCMVAIPKKETRRIEQMAVFTITSLSAIFAYIWLLLILKVMSPNVVEVWEAALTLGFFVILIVVAYFADKQFCCRSFALRQRWAKKGKTASITPAATIQPNGNGLHVDEYTLKDHMEVDEVMKETHTEGPLEDELKDVDEEDEGEEKHPNAVRHPSAKSTRPATALTRPSTRQEGKPAPSPTPASRPHTSHSHGLRYIELERAVAGAYPDASAETIARLTAKAINAEQPHSRLFYRIKATRQITGGAGDFGEAPVLERHRERPDSAGSTVTLRKMSAVPASRLSVIEFAAKRYAVSESDGHVRLKVVRHGRSTKRVLFKYETLDGTASAGRDFLSWIEAQTETLVFNSNEVEKFVTISLIADAEKEPDEVFYVKLGLEDFADGSTLIGQNAVATVTISDSNKDTKIQFVQAAIVVKENDGVVHVPVVRRGNTHNSLSVNWRTVDGSAKEGTDYYGGTGQISFESGEVEKWITLTIIDDKAFEKHESFEVQLTDLNGSESGTLNPKKRRCVVTILNDDETTLLLTQSDKLVSKELEALQPGGQTWGEQIRCAVNVNGGDLQSASKKDYVIHVLSFGWKLVFSLVPPPHFLGGWVTFFLALVLIGVLTAIVGDLAAIFGCLIGLEDSVTAITFVAIGTSLPDLFASKLAATSEKTADNSVGNVTGSNSVNVFLGLGISWLIGSIYREAKGEKFLVDSGSLAFTVVIYTIVSVTCLGLLLLRRQFALFGYAELGGPSGPKYVGAMFLVFLWFLYVLLSSLEAYQHIKGF